MNEAVTEVPVASVESCRDLLVAAVIEAVRKHNAEGELATTQMLQEVAQAAWQDIPEQQREAEKVLAMPELSSLLAGAAGCCQDWSSIEGPEGEVFYFMTSVMSRMYAEIMSRKMVPHLLIAEEVRRNSREYPRTIPLEIFEYPPFGLSVQQVQEALKFLSENPDFADITFTTSSVGTIYLFSTNYVDRTYGEFLAEHADVTRATSP